MISDQTSVVTSLCEREADRRVGGYGIQEGRM